ncbi:oleosin S1-2 [Typha latifolia]|uniref:oleosin S1-2 n=1 Tax=Typha latifolia TaxID=4733 RepID=UPI003C30A6EA
MDEQQTQERSEQHLSSSSTATTTVLYATLASLLIGGPLLGMMGFTLLASTTLLVVTSPLLLLFSPVLLPSAFVIVAAMAGFAFAAAMAFGGLLALTWACSYVGGGRGPAVVERIAEMLTGSGERTAEEAKQFGGYLKEKGEEIVPEDRVNGES